MKYRVLAVLLCAGVAAGPLPGQSIKTGVEAWQKADYAAAVAIWRPIADKGNADAAFNLGQAYRLGRGVPLDLAAARAWFERAAHKGHLDAQATLGLMLFQSGDHTSGLHWLKLAADRGEPRAMLVYGTAMFNGDGMPRDPRRGYLYVWHAAEAGLEPAAKTLQMLDQILPVQERELALELALDDPGETAAPATEPVRTAAASPARPAARPAVKASGAWRIQLGAFSKRSSAEALFAKLSEKAALNGRSAFYAPYGSITRLHAGPFESQASAQAACNALKPQPCFPVSAK